MRKLLLISTLLLWSFSALAAPPQTEDQKALYALGVHMAKQLAIFNLSAEEYEFVKEGITDAAAGKKLVAEPENYMQQLNQLAQSRMQAAAQKQKELAQPFLEKAAAEKGAEKTASGLVYQEIKAGTGAQPKAVDKVKVHYVGTLMDGKEFDSSIRRGEPAEFELGQVIPCWTEGLAKMKTGGKSKLVCPAELAYGDQGRPPVIPGGAVLVFEVELLDVTAAPVPAPAVAPKKPSASKKSSKK